MFGIGFTELVLIIIVALIFIGPKKLPDIAKAAGRAFAEFRKAADDLKRQVTDTEFGDVEHSAGWRSEEARHGGGPKDHSTGEREAADEGEKVAPGVGDDKAADPEGPAGSEKGPAGSETGKRKTT